MNRSGHLGTWKFEGEQAFSNDHPPLFVTYPVKSGTGDMPPGMVLALDSNGEVSPYTGSGAVAGVNNEPYSAGELYCACLAHGTAKARLLVKDGNAALEAADTQALRTMGVFPV